MKLFECRRYKDDDDAWKGALLIVAEKESRAAIIFIAAEGIAPLAVIDMGVVISGNARILYNDDMR